MRASDSAEYDGLGDRRRPYFDTLDDVSRAGFAVICTL